MNMMSIVKHGAAQVQTATAACEVPRHVDTEISNMNMNICLSTGASVSHDVLPKSQLAVAVNVPAAAGTVRSCTARRKTSPIMFNDQ